MKAEKLIRNTEMWPTAASGLTADGGRSSTKVGVALSGWVSAYQH